MSQLVFSCTKGKQKIKTCVFFINLNCYNESTWFPWVGKTTWTQRTMWNGRTDVHLLTLLTTQSTWFPWIIKTTRRRLARVRDLREIDLPFGRNNRDFLLRVSLVFEVTRSQGFESELPRPAIHLCFLLLSLLVLVVYQLVYDQLNKQHSFIIS